MKSAAFDQRIIFGPFVRTEIAIVRPLTESIDPFLYWWIDSKLDQAPRGLRVKAAAQGVQQSIQPGCSIHDLSLHVRQNTNASRLRCETTACIRAAQMGSSEERKPRHRSEAGSWDRLAA